MKATPRSVLWSDPGMAGAYAGAPRRRQASIPDTGFSLAASEAAGRKLGRDPGDTRPAPTPACG
jgi:hypothetical protein